MTCTNTKGQSDFSNRPLFVGEFRTSLPHNHACNSLPPTWIVPPHVEREALSDDQQGQGVEIDLVNTLIYIQVAGHAEKDEQVNAKSEEIVVEQEVKAAKGGIHEDAGRDEDEAAVKLRALAPENGEADERAEGEHVEERDAEKSVLARFVETERVEAGHDDGRCNTQRDHDGGEAGAEPSEKAMPTDFADAHQRGLGDEDEHPRSKSRAMKPEDQGPRNRGMEEVGIDGALEPGDYERGQQQRHKKIEVALQEHLWSGRCCFL